jgi:hypothetical protein
MINEGGQEFVQNGPLASAQHGDEYDH